MLPKYNAVPSNRVHRKSVNWSSLFLGGCDSRFFVSCQIIFTSLVSFFLQERLAKRDEVKKNRRRPMTRLTIFIEALYCADSSVVSEDVSPYISGLLDFHIRTVREELSTFTCMGTLRELITIISGKQVPITRGCVYSRVWSANWSDKFLCSRNTHCVRFIFVLQCPAVLRIHSEIR